MKQRHLRVGDALHDGTVLVRGGALEYDLLRQDALRNAAVYAAYGLSVFAAREATVDELAQQTPLIRFTQLTVLTAAGLRAAGLRLDPTGRNPRHFDIGFDELEARAPELVVPGAILLAGNPAAQAVVRIVAVE